MLGLTVRWNAYRTLYYDNPGNMAALAKELHAKLAGGGFQPNPARSELVGVLGLWRKGEPPANPASARSWRNCSHPLSRRRMSGLPPISSCSISPTASRKST